MNRIDTGKLIQTLKDTPEYKGFDSSEAVRYLYNKLFVPSCDENSRVSLSDFDFEAFELDDIPYLQDICDGMFYRNIYNVHFLQGNLIKLPPKATPTRYI